MQRIKAQHNVSSLPAPDENSYDPGYFSDGDAATGTKGTMVSAAWANGVQEELLTVITNASLTPDITDNTQLYTAIRSMIVNTTYPVGSIYMSTRSTSPATLFGMGTWVQIRDRMLIGAGSTYTAGNSGGSATASLVVSNLPAHNHTATCANGGAVSAQTLTTVSEGAHTHTITITSGGGTHSHSGTSGSAGKHSHTRGSMEITGSFQLKDNSGTIGCFTNRSGAFTITNNNRNWRIRCTEGREAGDVLNLKASNSWTGSTSVQAAHTHSISVSGGAHNHTASCGSKGAHTHSVTVPAISAHSHTVTIGSTGSGASFSVLNPYYAVYMWRRTA